MGLNGHTKPSITSTNGNGTISNGKQESIVMRIPKLPFLSNKNQSSALCSSELENKPNSTPVLLTSIKNNNHSFSHLLSLPSVQSKSTASSTISNGLTSISTSYNHHNENDDDSSEIPQPVQKKQRIEDLSSLVPSSQSNSIDEQSVPSPSLRVKLNEKKKKSHQHHHENQSRS